MKRRCILLALVLATIACGEKKPDQFTEDKSLYEYATQLYDGHSYSESIPFFESLSNRFPQSPYAIDSELKVADAYFQQEEYASAEVSYQSFRSLHPTHSKVPYALFQTGLCHFKQMPRGSGRDPSHVEKAVEIFSDLLARYPESDLAPQAKEHRMQARRKLVERDLYVANFYLKRNEYSAAMLRLESVRASQDLDDLRSEATYKLAYAYFKLQETSKARELLNELVQDNDASEAYRKNAQKLLSKIQ